MSKKSVWFRDQAKKCVKTHADKISDDVTEKELRKLAAEYIARAVAIEERE